MSVVLSEICEYSHIRDGVLFPIEVKNKAFL